MVGGKNHFFPSKMGWTWNSILEFCIRMITADCLLAVTEFSRVSRPYKKCTVSNLLLQKTESRFYVFILMVLSFYFLWRNSIGGAQPGQPVGGLSYLRTCVNPCCCWNNPRILESYSLTVLLITTYCRISRNPRILEWGIPKKGIPVESHMILEFYSRDWQLLYPLLAVGM
jgi:hypothetical protein